tara:strand:- start:338 stop:688 length:351 start_codon:yes stop_codon:yes gene_type:complete
MNAQLTPAIIEKQYSKYLNLADAQCLFDLFTNQVAQGQWLDARTVACWMFKTNNPSEFQLMRAKSLLHNLSSSILEGRRETCLLDMKIQYLDSGYGSTLIKPAYKLSSTVSNTLHV